MPPERLTAQPANNLKRSSPRPLAGPYEPAVDYLNDTAIAAANEHHALEKRAGVTDDRQSWALGYLSVPPDMNVNSDEWSNALMRTYKYKREDSNCQGQYVYVVENQFDETHSVSLSPFLGFIDGTVQAD